MCPSKKNKKSETAVDIDLPLLYDYPQFIICSVNHELASTDLLIIKATIVITDRFMVKDWPACTLMQLIDSLKAQ
jgi:hypothetical protein